MSISNPATSLRNIRLTWRAAGSAVLLLSLGAWWFLFACPVLASRQNLAAHQTQIDLLQSQKQSIIAKLAQVSGAAKQGDEEEEHRQARVPTSHNEAIFLQWVSQEAIDCGLAVRDFRPAGQALHGEYESQTLKLSATGSYIGISQFLDKLRACPRMNRVTNVEITPIDAKRSAYSFSMQIMLFMKKPTATKTV